MRVLLYPKSWHEITRRYFDCETSMEAGYGLLSYFPVRVFIWKTRKRSSERQFVRIGLLSNRNSYVLTRFLIRKWSKTSTPRKYINSNICRAVNILNNFFVLMPWMSGCFYGRLIFKRSIRKFWKMKLVGFREKAEDRHHSFLSPEFTCSKLLPILTERKTGHECWTICKYLRRSIFSNSKVPALYLRWAPILLSWGRLLHENNPLEIAFDFGNSWHFKLVRWLLNCVDVWKIGVSTDTFVKYMPVVCQTDFEW